MKIHFQIFLNLVNNWLPNLGFVARAETYFGSIHKIFYFKNIFVTLIFDLWSVKYENIEKSLHSSWYGFKQNEMVYSNFVYCIPGIIGTKLITGVGSWQCDTSCHGSHDTHIPHYTPDHGRLMILSQFRHVWCQGREEEEVMMNRLFINAKVCHCEENWT